MKLPYISRRRHDIEIAALRRRVVDTETRHDDAEAERRRVAKLLDEAGDLSARLVAELADARTRLAKYEVRQPLTDPAADITAWEKAVAAHLNWKQSGDVRLIEGGTLRPTHPALILRRALERCRALEARLAAAEGRKGVLR
ncbi:hypothetical protein [Streptomyces acidiscabies]|uniref:Uncharacterized protein n=1 Tax=Streptomyces acidiscabies TaxID=42234 RepID=A0ABU4LWN2_9ACTN|nr:hypothetical protein [Streptomyces acidiscabies]MDX3019911.1 hypothetical protein [Streptomyces acidiscabies]